MEVDIGSRFYRNPIVWKVIADRKVKNHIGNVAELKAVWDKCLRNGPTPGDYGDATAVKAAVSTLRSVLGKLPNAVQQRVSALLNALQGCGQSSVEAGLVGRAGSRKSAERQADARQTKERSPSRKEFRRRPDSQHRRKSKTRSPDVEFHRRVAGIRKLRRGSCEATPCKSIRARPKGSGSLLAGVWLHLQRL